MKTGIFLILLLLVPGALFAGERQDAFVSVDPDPLGKAHKLLFVENKGQVKGRDGSVQPEILYVLKSPELTVFVHRHGLYYQFSSTSVDSSQRPNARESSDSLKAQTSASDYYQVRMELMDATGEAQAKGMNKTNYYENYYNVLDKPGGIRHVASFERVVIREVYPHIDWVLSVEQGNLKYDFIIHPGGQVEDIKLNYQGAQGISTKDDGSLLIQTPLGEIKEDRPYTYQQRGNEQTAVDCRYSLLDAQTVGFKVGDYLQDKPLVIDPSVQWATYYGGGGQEYGMSTAIDEAGQVYLAGWTESGEAIAEAGHQERIGGHYDAFLVKFDASGNRLWASYYGGSETDQAYQVVLHSDMNVYMTGGTKSADGIAANGFQNTYQGGGDAFLVKFSPTGERQWASYYGGEGYDSGHGIALDVNNNLYLTGITDSETGIASEAYQNTLGGQYDAFLVKFNASGQRQWATYYGGSKQDNTLDGHKGSVAVDKAGNVYIAGWTSSLEGIASGGFQDLFQGGGDAFLVKFNSQGDRLWGTYYGGEGFDSGRAVAIDRNNDVYLSGVTRSTSGIASEGFQNAFAGFYDAFLVKFDESGRRKWGTYYGGSGQDEAKGDALSLDSQDNIYLAGFSRSSSDIASCGFQDTFGGLSDAFVVSFNPDGRRRWASYFGGEAYEIAYDAKIGPDDNLYLVGWTTSEGGIASNGFQAQHGGSGDAFLLKVDATTNRLEEPEISVDGNLLLCPGEGVTLSVPFREGLNYVWSHNGQPLAEEGPEIMVRNAGSYSVEVTNGCETEFSEAVEVQVVEAAERPVITASGPLSFCAGESVRLSVAGEGPLSYQWLKDGLPVGEDSFEFIASESGVYTVVCSHECGSIDAEAVTIEQKAAPLAPEVYEGIECGPARVTLSASSENADEYHWYANENDSEPIPGENAATFKTPLLETSKTYYVSAISGNCESERVAVKAGVEIIPEANAGEDLSLALGEQVQLQAGDGLSGLTYQWSPAEGLDNDQVPNPVARPEKTTTYTLTVSNAHGCSAVDEITVSVINEVFIPNAFSPNNDGRNDVWEIFNMEIYPQCKILVFDRWGNRVYQSTGYEESWDGRYGGEVVPPGSYTFFIQLDADHEPLKGTLLIIY